MKDDESARFRDGPGLLPVRRNDRHNNRPRRCMVGLHGFIVLLSIDEPPVVLVCLANTAECHQTFISSDHVPLATTATTKGANKCENGDFRSNSRELPAMQTAVATLNCSRYDSRVAGDHTILLGRVDKVDLDLDTDPLSASYFRRLIHPTPV